MSLSLIQTVLGASFVLIWIFIGTMILRDRQLAIRGEQEAGAVKRLSARRTQKPPSHAKAVGPKQNAGQRRGASAA